MKESENIILPGGFKPFRILKQKYEFDNQRVLIIGESTERIATKFFENKAISVDVIVRDYDSLIQSRLKTSKEKNISIRFNEFDNTDFPNNYFDFVYAQGSISSSNRKNVIKEIKRILKNSGILCLTELTKLQDAIPPFIKNTFEQSSIVPQLHSQCVDYFINKGFQLIYEQDLTSSLKHFYENIHREFSVYLKKADEAEKKLYKKLLNKINHESNVYLKLGGEKYIGLILLILRKK
jgi:ubiquinone/menaquinone biosynthesis C-methylase UbiE